MYGACANSLFQAQQYLSREYNSFHEFNSDKVYQKLITKPFFLKINDESSILMMSSSSNPLDVLKNKFYDATNTLLERSKECSTAPTSQMLSAYNFILTAGSWEITALRNMAADIIPKYFFMFPELFDRAIDSQLDLCEDEDVLIRRNAVKNLPLFSLSEKRFALRIADALCQLLQSDEEIEFEIAKDALMNSMRMHPQGNFLN